MRVVLVIFVTLVICTNALWLPFANLEAIFETIREAAIGEGTNDGDDSFTFAGLTAAGRELFSGISQYFTEILTEEDRHALANGIREFFNVTTTAPITNTATTEQPRYIFPYTRPSVPVQERTAAMSVLRTTTTATPSTSLTSFSSSLTQRFTTYSPVIIWPTTTRTAIQHTTTGKFTWIPVTPLWERTAPHPTSHEFVHQTFTKTSTTTDNVPIIIKAKKFTRPPPTLVPSTSTSSPRSLVSCNFCQTRKQCQVYLRSFDTIDPVFQYAYGHSTVANSHMQIVLRETQRISFPTSLSWKNSVTPEVIQFTKSLISLYQPSRFLVIGVFTGLGLLGIAEQVEAQSLIIALEHPSYVQYWEEVGSKIAEISGHAYISRIELRSAEPIERALPKLAAIEKNNFDFVFLDDLKRENYLDDYEHAIRLLRPGGLLVIDQALNNGGVLTGVELMTDSDRVISSMNVRIKEDGRVRASLLPFGGGTWMIVKK